MPFRILAILPGLALTLGARAALQDALVARDVLADVVATCVVRIDYAPSGRSRPPVFATAFRLEDVLWLYSPEIGTRALGPVSGAWPDSEKLSARLQQLEPSITRVAVYPHPVPPLVRQEQFYLNNACVIASLFSLTHILNTEEHITEAGLILMAFDSDSAQPANDITFLVNHCVLAYRQNGEWWCLDPNRRGQPLRLKSIAVGAPLDPVLVTLALQQSYPLKSVHLLALSPATFDHIAGNARWRTVAANK